MTTELTADSLVSSLARTAAKAAEEGDDKKASSGGTRNVVDALKKSVNATVKHQHVLNAPLHRQERLRVRLYNMHTLV